MSLMRLPSFAYVSALVFGLVIIVNPAPSTAGRLTCRDGDPNTIISPRGAAGPPFCNHDQPGDGACTFAICSVCPFTRGCVGPESGVCADGALPPGAEVVTVPVKQKRVRRIGTSRVGVDQRGCLPHDKLPRRGEHPAGQPLTLSVLLTTSKQEE
jgi:hypothetical protein